jgi:hypothetical protein
VAERGAVALEGAVLACGARPASSATSRVPQLAQKRAPATIGAPHVGQPMGEPHRTQNLASVGFSAEHVAQITVPRL